MTGDPPRRDLVGVAPGARRLRARLILQADSFNRSRIQTALGVVLSSNPGPRRVARQRLPAPGPIPVYRETRVANVSQIVTADKRFLTISILDHTVVPEVEHVIRLVLGLE